MKKIILLSVLLLIPAAVCTAQRLRPSTFPRVAELRSDESAGRSHDGCDNHILNRRNTYRAIFTSDREGRDAWMNLNGHNVELTLIETHIWHEGWGYGDAIYKYRYKNVRVTVRLSLATDYISAIPAIVWVKSGGITRRFRVEIGAQCD